MFSPEISTIAKDLAYLNREVDCGGGYRIPALGFEALGDRGFLEDHRLRYPLMAGAMANGIASVELVEAMGRGGMLGSFGAAGLSPSAVEAALDRLQRAESNFPFAVNLIHSPAEPRIEEAIVELYLKRSIRLVEASAYLNLTPALVRYRVSGLYRNERGEVCARNRVIGKVSRVEVARRFLEPAPSRIVQDLLSRGLITEEAARLSSLMPMADDLTAEADSGGHTDNQPAIVLLPTMLALREEIQQKLNYAKPPRIGAAGGISTPWATAAAFAMGAAYVVTGSVNQACIESGSSSTVRGMLADLRQSEVTMAPAADMFEMGVKVQVIKRGTMFPMRATKLFELYRQYESIDALLSAEKELLEKTIFRKSIDEVWSETQRFFLERDPHQLARAEKDPKHQMALLFRWYLGQSSRWANQGIPDRKLDYQIWCGPAMAAFNDWTRGSFLEKPEARACVLVSLNLLYGAAVVLRAQMVRSIGIPLPVGIPAVKPVDANEVMARCSKERSSESTQARAS